MSRQTRPVIKLDSQLNTLNDSEHDLEFRGEYSGTSMIYAGFARPGSDEGNLVWKIMKLAYDIAGNLTSVKWPINASGAVSSDFEFSWSGRAGYTYV